MEMNYCPKSLEGGIHRLWLIGVYPYRNCQADEIARCINSEKMPIAMAFASHPQGPFGMTEKGEHMEETTYDLILVLRQIQD